MILRESAFVYRVSPYIVKDETIRYFDSICISKELYEASHSFRLKDQKGFGAINEDDCIYRDADWKIQKLIEEQYPSIKDEFSFTIQPIRVKVDFVNASNELDVLALKSDPEFGKTYKNAVFILNSENKYIVGREVEKMSKSKFNVVNPDAICEQYGADTLRLYEMFLGPLEQAKPWSTAGITGVYNFCLLYTSPSPRDA